MLSADEDSPADMRSSDKVSCNISRKATGNIKSELMNIYREAYENYPEYGAVNENEIQSYFHYLEKVKPEGFLVATLQDEILGFVVEDPNCFEQDEEEVGEVVELVVSPRAKGKGLGRKLLQLAIYILGQQGCNKIYLEVGKDNKEAQNLYRKCGFGYILEKGKWFQMIKDISEEPTFVTPEFKEVTTVAENK